MAEVRGSAAADIEVNLKRARELCDQAAAPATVVLQALHGLWLYYFSIASFEMARGLAGQILALGKEQDDKVAALTGYFALGVTCCWTGEYRAAATTLEQSITIGERLLPGCPKPMLRHLMGVLVSSRANLSWTQWMLGYPEQALRQIDRLDALPERLRGRFEMAAIIDGDIGTRCHFRRDYRGGRQKAEALIGLARENGFALFEALGPIYLGQVAVQEGAIDQGIKAMLQGTEALRAAGENLVSHWANYALAEAFLTTGRATEGLTVVNEAIAASDQLQMRYYEAEVHRLKGELLLLARAEESEAEASMREAIAIAQRQGAKGWELRAATSLAWLLRKQGRIEPAREVLAPVYNWFTEGFDTADLKDAKALLDELSH
jgi:predicted ATPase